MKIIFACGGTAGHINPALAIAEEIIKRKTDAEILFIGTEDRMETELIPRAGYEIETIKITNLSRKISFDSLIKNFQTAKNVFTSIAKCKKILKGLNLILSLGQEDMSVTPLFLQLIAWEFAAQYMNRMQFPDLQPSCSRLKQI